MDDIVAKPMNTKALQRMLSENDRRKLEKKSTNAAPGQPSPIAENRQAAPAQDAAKQGEKPAAAQAVGK